MSSTTPSPRNGGTWAPHTLPIADGHRIHHRYCTAKHLDAAADRVPGRYPPSVCNHHHSPPPFKESSSISINVACRPPPPASLGTATLSSVCGLSGHPSTRMAEPPARVRWRATACIFAGGFTEKSLLVTRKLRVRTWLTAPTPWIGCSCRLIPTNHISDLRIHEGFYKLEGWLYLALVV